MSARVRLHALCPYFAMFPESFVREQVERYTRATDVVFDPFCGRGTTVLEALLLGRAAAGSDISPVAYCVSAAKADRPALDRVLARLRELEMSVARELTQSEEERRALPPFFRRAFQAETLHELLFLRRTLRWRRNRNDRFIAALVLGSLHGEMDKSSAYFSNQMPRTICLKPDYSLRYWRSHGLFAPRRHVFEMLRKKAENRLGDAPDCGRGVVRQTDARRVAARFPNLRGRVALVITSPPYLHVTRYEEDQWLRLWFLGGPPKPTYGLVSRDDRHHGATRYWKFLTEAWTGLAPLLKKRATLVVRLGALGLAQDELVRGIRKSVRSVFSQTNSLGPPRCTALIGKQTGSFLPDSRGCQFEMDFAFCVNQ